VPLQPTRRLFPRAGSALLIFVQEHHERCRDERRDRSSSPLGAARLSVAAWSTTLAEGIDIKVIKP